MTNAHLQMICLENSEIFIIVYFIAHRIQLTTQHKMSHTFYKPQAGTSYDNKKVNQIKLELKLL